MTDRTAGLWLVSGASSGFGRALVQAVLEQGWRVVAATRAPAMLEDLVTESAGRLRIISFDAGNARSAPAIVAGLEAELGPIDVLVNNAGYGLIGAVEEIDEDELRSIMEVNFFGTVALTKAVLPSMRKRRSGFIINMSSISGVTAPAGSGGYAASKFAMEGLSESLRRECRDLGIKVMIVEPGPFRTAFHSNPGRLALRQLGAYAKVDRRREAARLDPPPQFGDPARGACAILKAVNADQPPERLILGAAAVASIRTALEHRLAELEKWSSVSAEADHP